MQALSVLSAQRGIATRAALRLVRVASRAVTLADDAAQIAGELAGRVIERAASWELLAYAIAFVLAIVVSALKPGHLWAH